MQSELKPCPFCESRVISKYRDEDYWIIKCAQCGAEISHTQHHKACFAWNRRAGEQRGKLEGARLAIEAVLPEVVTDWTIDAHGAHCRCTTCELNIAEDSIRALDPAKIVGEV